MVKLIVFDFHGTLSLKSGKVNRIFSLMFEKKLQEKEEDEEKQEDEEPEEPPIHIAINDLKNILKNYKNGSWYEAMKKVKIDPELMMPTLNEIIHFIDYMKELHPKIVFGVASMLEEEQFMYDLLKYCFEMKGKVSPFTLKTIVSSSGLKEVDVKSESSNDKWPHITVILQRNDLKFGIEDIVIIDDNEMIVQYMSDKGFCSILASHYFTIQDWNGGCFNKF